LSTPSATDSELATSLTDQKVTAGVSCRSSHSHDDDTVALVIASSPVKWLDRRNPSWRTVRSLLGPICLIGSPYGLVCDAASRSRYSSRGQGNAPHYNPERLHHPMPTPLLAMVDSLKSVVSRKRMDLW